MFSSRKTAKLWSAAFVRKTRGKNVEDLASVTRRHTGVFGRLDLAHFFRSQPVQTPFEVRRCPPKRRGSAASLRAASGWGARRGAASHHGTCARSKRRLARVG